MACDDKYQELEQYLRSSERQISTEGEELVYCHRPAVGRWADTFGFSCVAG